MQQRGVVVWLTGLSGAGKSTLAALLDDRLRDLGRKSFVLDGDCLRQGLCQDLGFNAEGRTENIRRAGQVARLMAQAGLVTICSFISPFKRDRQCIRDGCIADQTPFMEVFVHAPLSLCEERDPKGLYRLARSGQISQFTGIDSPYEEPERPDITLCTSAAKPAECVKSLLERVMELSGTFEG